MKKLILPLVLVFLCGCASANRNVFNVEFAAASTAEAFMKGYARYWKEATNNPAAYNTDLNNLTIQRAQISQYSVKVGASVEIVDNIRESASTNKLLLPTLQTAINSLDSVTTLLVNSTTNILGQ